MKLTPARLAGPLLFAISASAGAAFVPVPVPLGLEFQINSYTPGQQAGPSAAVDAAGNFVVVWRSYQDGSQLGVFSQRFDSAGAPRGVEFQVNTTTVNFEYGPVVASEDDGDFVVVWHSYGQDGSGPGIFLQRYDSGGAKLGVELQVNTFTTGTQRFATIGMDADGDFVVAWNSNFQDGYSYGVFARRFSSSGSPQAVEFQVNSYTFAVQGYPIAAMEDDGDFVVVWHSGTQDGDGFGVFGQRFSSAGTRQGGEFQVSSYTTGNERFAALAMDADGDFVVAWEDPRDGAMSGIFAQRFTSSGLRAGSEFQVNTYTAGVQARLAAGMDANGDFVIVWAGDQQDGDLYGMFGQAWSSSGVRAGPELQLNNHTSGSQDLFATPRPSGVAMRADGRFLVVWGSDLQDGSNYGVFGRRFSPLGSLDVDGNGSLQPLTDGLLILRYQFGFTGDTLIAGAVDQGGCTRCTATDITSFIDALPTLLDIDGDGSRGPLTDGLLVLRYLFGFTGDTLTAGTVAGGCTRCTAAAIKSYLDSIRE